jgi:hypothetical protein
LPVYVRIIFEWRETPKFPTEHRLMQQNHKVMELNSEVIFQSPASIKNLLITFKLFEIKIPFIFKLSANDRCSKYFYRSA